MKTLSVTLDAAIEVAVAERAKARAEFEEAERRSRDAAYKLAEVMSYLRKLRAMRTLQKREENKETP